MQVQIWPDSVVAKKLFHFIVFKVKDHLFNSIGLGIDLIAIDIQRGRDHGLPGYVTYRRMCRPGEEIKFFEDLRSDMTAQVMQNFRSIAVCQNGGWIKNSSQSIGY